MESLRIGPVTFRVLFEPEVVSDEGEQLDGAIIWSNQTIRVKAGMGTHHTASVLWHEIMHAVLDQCNLCEIGDKEGAVDALGQAILRVLQDNPGLRTLGCDS